MIRPGACQTRSRWHFPGGTTLGPVEELGRDRLIGRAFQLRARQLRDITYLRQSRVQQVAGERAPDSALHSETAVEGVSLAFARRWCRIALA